MIGVEDQNDLIPVTVITAGNLRRPGQIEQAMLMIYTKYKYIF